MRWPILADGLHGLLTANYTQFLELAWPLIVKDRRHSQLPNNGHEAIDGIRCSNASFRTDNVTTLYPYINEFYAKSKIMGDGLSLLALTCAQWPFHENECYKGDFRVKATHPVLFIGNTVDPVTTLVSAYNMSSGFQGSVVLQHGLYGVCWRLALHFLINANTELK